MRDDFSQKVIDTLAKRVGHVCSRPGCDKKTSGPHTEQDKALNLGVAAHITAASLGGPRFDASLTPKQRRSIENGIWLCQYCAKLIDNDKSKFTTTLIRQWKQEAEDRREHEIDGRNREHKSFESNEVVPRTASRPDISYGRSEPLAVTKPGNRGEVGQVESAEIPPPVPSLEQMSLLVKALNQFVWHDSASFSFVPWAQERLRLPGFVRVADAILPLRVKLVCVGWPGWLPELLSSVIVIFDTIAHAWGWENIITSEHHRILYMQQCEAAFREKYLIPIQAAARLCRGNFSIVDRPHWLEELTERTASIDFDLMPIGAPDHRLGPLWMPLHEKRNALMYGINYPTLSGIDSTDTLHDFSAEIALGAALGQATQKLSHAVERASKPR